MGTHTLQAACANQTTQLQAVIGLAVRGDSCARCLAIGFKNFFFQAYMDIITLSAFLTHLTKL